MKNSNQTGNTAIYIMLSVIIALLVLIIFMLVGNQPSIAIPESLMQPKTCEYNGQTYKVGEGFTAEDGCNSCGCSENGQVACTSMACEASTPPEVIIDPTGQNPTLSE